MTGTGEYARPADCACGHGYAEHNIEVKTRPCSRLSCDCKRYIPPGGE